MQNGGEMMCPMCLSVLLIGLLWVVLFILLIAGMIWAIRLAKREGYFSRKARSTDRAIAILKEHYAKGEIDQKEYEEKKRIWRHDLSSETSFTLKVNGTALRKWEVTIQRA